MPAGRQARATRPGEKPRRRRGPFSTISGQILALNVVAIGILVAGLLYLDQYRSGLVEAQIRALRTQAEIIAAALGEAAERNEADEYMLDEEETRRLLRRLVEPIEQRARVFATDGVLIADSRELLEAGRVVQFRPLPGALSFRERAYEFIVHNITGTLLPQPSLPLYTEAPIQKASDYAEVVRALFGDSAGAIRSSNRTADAGLVISVAVPVQSFRRVLGALMITADGRAIEASVRDIRLAILQVSGFALAITVLLSLYLAGTIARPVRRLAAAAEQVRRGRGREVQIPDFRGRRDEIGDLSRSLREMTQSLYRRIDANEAFAADVAHEIKNPLTSLRSAVETFARTQDEAQRVLLLGIIRDDVNRINRLITDISDASRLDAELSRAALAAVDIRRIVETVAEVHQATAGPDAPRLDVEAPPDVPLRVLGIEDRLGQVLRNLVSNAVSFSPPGGAIRLVVAPLPGMVEIRVEDEGPGIPPENVERVFERFYTSRPTGEAFGKHSGLGLSISKQVVEAHGGSIQAANRTDETGRVLGARMTVRLPAAA